MKKYLVIILVVVSMMAMIVGTVEAAPMTAGTTFLGAVFTAGGATFTFSVDEKLPMSKLKATVLWDGGSVRIRCSQRQDGNTVTCSAPRSVVDKNITISFQGMTFATYVKSRLFCYSVWDFYPDNPYSGTWSDYGPYCQDEPAQYDDVIKFYNPDYGSSYWYYFWWEEDCYGTGITGNAYYFC